MSRLETKRPAPTQLDEFASFIEEWIENGGRNSADLFRLLKDKGCKLSYDAVRRYVNRRLGSTGRPGPRDKQAKPVNSRSIPTARKLSYEFIRPDAMNGGILNELPPI